MKVFDIVVFLSVLLSVSLALFLFFLYLIYIFMPEQLSEIVTVSSAIIIAIISAASTKYFERKIAIESENRIKKIEVYESLLKSCNEAIFNRKDDNPESDENKKIDHNFNISVNGILTWGSNDVVNKMHSFMKELYSKDNDGRSY